jgi:lambda family phage tail tape measure protein
MATIDRYRVVVDTADATRSLDGLRTAVGALIAAFSVRELAQFSDSVTNVRNRLNQLTPGIDDTSEQFRALAGIAISARAPLEETADLYFRISRAAGSLGISQREAAEVTSLVAKAITASGISAQEASGPLLQLGQALQSGRLQGDELRSIMEGLPPVSRALADSLGVPIGALKELGSQGKISAQDVITAIQQARDSIERDFGATTATIGQATETLRTSLSLAFDQFNQNTGASQAVAQAIEYIAFQIFRLSQNVEDIIGPLRTFAQVVGALVIFATTNKLITVFVGAIRTVAGAITAAVGAIGGLRFAFSGLASGTAIAGGGIVGFAANVVTSLTPLGRLARLAVTVGSALAAWIGIGNAVDDIEEMGDATSDTAQAIADWKAEMAALTGELNNTVETTGVLNSALTELQDTTAKGLGDYREANQDFLESLRITRENLDLSREQIGYNETIRRFAEDYRDRIRDLRGELEELNKSPERNADLIAQINTAIAETTAEYESQRPAIEAIASEIQRVQEQQREATEAAREQAEAIREAAEAARILERATQGADGFIRDVTRSTEELERQMRQLNMNPLERQIDDIETDIRRKLQDRVRELQALKSDTNAAQIEAEIQRITTAASGAIEQQARLARESYRQSRSFAEGWRRAFEEYADNATNASKRAEEIFRKTTQGLEDLLFDFIKTGRFNWKTFVQDITDTLLRSQLQQLIARTFAPDGLLGGVADMFGLGDLFGGGGGGAGSQRGNSPSTPLYVADVTSGARTVGNLLGGSTQGGGLGGSIKNVVSGLGNAVSGIFGGGGSSGGLGSTISKGISSLFGGFFANGGFLPAGKFGIVGERGPEMIGGPAQITPMAGSVTYNINAVDAASFKAMVARDPGFIHAVASQGARALPTRR